MLFYLSQAVGIAGLLVAAYSFQKNSNEGILKLQVIATLLFFTHFTLLGAYTGAAMNLMGAARNIVFYNRKKRWAGGIQWMYIFIVLFAAGGIVTWKNAYSLLPMLAMIIATVGLYIKNPRTTRLLLLPASPCWLIYNIVSGSVAGTLTEIFILSSLCIAIVRFDILKQPEPVPAVSEDAEKMPDEP